MAIPRAAIAQIYLKADQFCIDPEKLHVTGNSAGGHLAAMVAVTDWERDYGLPSNIIKSGYPISGLYDLEPFRWTWLQPKIQFTAEQVHRNSPIRLIKENLPPLLISWGADESAEFWRQSQEFSQAWAAKGNSSELLPQSESDHSSAISGFSDPSSTLCKAIFEHMEASWTSTDCATI